MAGKEMQQPMCWLTLITFHCLQLLQRSHNLTQIQAEATWAKTGKKDIKDIDCFKCGLKGQYAHKCPNNEKQGEEVVDVDDEIHTLNATWEGRNILYYTSSK